jgi:hypothetical protein
VEVRWVRGAKVTGYGCMSPWGWRIVLSGYYCSDRCWLVNGK